MTNNTNSKGWSTNSKGGNPTSKADQISRGAPHPGGDATQNKERGKITSKITLPVPGQITQAPASQFKSLLCASQPNYNSQDEDNNQAPTRQTNRSTAKRIVQEAMLSCVDIYKPNYVVSMDLGILNYTKTPKPTGTTFTVMPKQMSQRKLPMKWLCKMANSVVEPVENSWSTATSLQIKAQEQHDSTHVGTRLGALLRERQGKKPAPTPLSSSRKTRYHITEQRTWPTD